VSPASERGLSLTTSSERGPTTANRTRPRVRTAPAEESHQPLRQGQEDGHGESRNEGEEAQGLPLPLAEPLSYAYVGRLVEHAGHRRSQQQGPDGSHLPTLDSAREGGEPQAPEDGAGEVHPAGTAQVAEGPEQRGQGAGDENPEAQGYGEERAGKLGGRRPLAEEHGEGVEDRPVADVDHRGQDDDQQPPVDGSVPSGYPTTSASRRSGTDALLFAGVRQVLGRELRVLVPYLLPHALRLGRRLLYINITRTVPRRLA
jgi:hypothetical protein